VAGFILFQIRHIPKVGEVIQFGSATPGAGRNLRLTVAQMIGPKIERLQVELVEPETRGSEPDG
jgi:CBS domain containing-hemolysin-like protein